MLGCSSDKAAITSENIDKIVDKKLVEFADAFEQKLKELDEIFQSVAQRQGRIESNSKSQSSDTKKMIETSALVLREHLSNVSKNTVRDFETRFEVREKVFQTELKTLTNKMDSVEDILLKEKERLDKLQQISGMSMMDVERKFDEKDEEVDTRIDSLTDQLDELKSSMENVHEKMYDYEASKKNNLIFYGIPKEDKETAKTLILKIKSIIQNRLNIKRYISISGACRLFSGPEVNNCQPIVVTFEEFLDRDEILKIAKLKRHPGFSVTEDLSKKTREARLGLRKYMRELKRKSPEKNCFMEGDKLFVEGKMFVFNETDNRVIEQRRVAEKIANKNQNLSPSPVSSLSRSSGGRLPERVRHLETLVEKQMRMIQEQQSIIEQQKCLLENRRNGKKIGNGNAVSLEESLEELIDREENGFDTDEDDNMN